MTSCHTAIWHFTSRKQEILQFALFAIHWLIWLGIFLMFNGKRCKFLSQDLASTFIRFVINHL